MIYKIEELNQVSDYEYALLMATIESMFDEGKMFDCHKCKNRYKGATDWEETSLKERTLKGCFDEVANWRIDNVLFKKCVGNFILSSTGSVISRFTMYEKGVLPYEGSLGEQPAKIIQIFEIISARRAEKIEQRKKKNNQSETQKRVNAKLARRRPGNGEHNRS